MFAQVKWLHFTSIFRNSQFNVFHRYLYQFLAQKFDPCQNSISNLSSSPQESKRRIRFSNHQNSILFSFRAMDDIRESIQELQYYKDNIFK